MTDPSDALGPGSLSQAPTKLRYVFMCTECGGIILMPAIPQNRDGQTFHCSICMEKTFFLPVKTVETVGAPVNLLFTL